MASDKEELIRAKAHEIWLEEGRPEGEEKRHWEMATAFVEAGMSVPEPATTETGAPEPPIQDPTISEPAASAPAEKAAPRKRAPRAKKTAAV